MPSIPRKYTFEELEQFRLKLRQKALQKRHKGPIRAINSSNQPVSLVAWLNSVYSGQRFFYNSDLILLPLVAGRRTKRDSSGRPVRRQLTNHEMWLETCEILNAMVHYWSVPLKGLPSNDYRRHNNPLVTDLVFRHCDDFRAGCWNEFRSFWLPYIAMLE